MKNAGKARSYGLYRHLRTSKEIIENLLNYSKQMISRAEFVLTPCFVIIMNYSKIFFTFSFSLSIRL